MRSLTSSDRIEELRREVEGCKWDAQLLSETWRPNQAELLRVAARTHFYGCRKIRERTRRGNTSEQDVAKKIKWTEYINEHAIAKSITVNKQRIMSMSVFFPDTGHADHHVERAYKTIEKLTRSRMNIQIVGGDINAELGPGICVERLSVGPHTLKETNKR